MRTQTVMTAGTYDILHESHINFLRNAKSLGQELIVMLSTDDFNEFEKGKRSFQDYETRKYVLEAIRYVDLVVPEQTWHDKALYVEMFGVNLFVMGDDWKGKFDDLRDQFPQLGIIYLPRGKTSSSQIKEDLGRQFIRSSSGKE